MPEEPSKWHRQRTANHAGEVFGRVIVLERSFKPHYRQAKWKCRCACGTVWDVEYYTLISGKVISCGCYRREMLSRTKATHGESRVGALTAEYRCWRWMKKRCLNPSSIGWADYGGRGITVCDRWLADYLNFLTDMGRKPSPVHSLDRIDVNGNYEPSNCKWATLSEQARNRRDAVKPRPCKGCKVPFIPLSGSAGIYCSQSCYHSKRPIQKLY